MCGFILTHLGLNFTLTTVVNVQTLPCLSRNHCKEDSVKSVKGCWFIHFSFRLWVSCCIWPGVFTWQWGTWKRPDVRLSAVLWDLITPKVLTQIPTESTLERLWGCLPLPRAHWLQPRRPHLHWFTWQLTLFQLVCYKIPSCVSFFLFARLPLLDGMPFFVVGFRGSESKSAGLPV